MPLLKFRPEEPGRISNWPYFGDCYLMLFLSHGKILLFNVA